MKHLVGKLKSRFSIAGISQENHKPRNKTLDGSISETTMENLYSLLASERAVFEMPASWPQHHKDSAYPGQSIGPLDLCLVIQQEAGTSNERVVAKKTSLEEILLMPVMLREIIPDIDEGLQEIADELRELADSIDEVLSQKSMRGPTSHLKLV